MSFSGGPGSACSRPRSCERASRSRAVAAAMASELGWDEARERAESERWVSDAAAEGIDAASGGEPVR